VRVLHYIDKLNDWVGKLFNPIFMLITFFAVYEVVRRYILGSPTIWVWEINSQLMCFIGAMAGGYALLKDSHVSVDIISNMLPPRVRAVVNIITWPFFFVLVGCVIFYGAKEAWRAYIVNQHEISTFGSPLFPIKAMIPIGGTLLLIQGIAKLIRDIRIAIGKTDR